MTYPRYAICNVAHPGSMESLDVMLSVVGVRCLVPTAQLRAELVRAGCDTVVSLDAIAESWGWPLPSFPTANLRTMARNDVIYVDVKAHRNGPKVWAKWPNLRRRTLWYFINGGKPADYTAQGKGNELDPPCPVLTPDLWYKETTIHYLGHDGNRVHAPAPWAGRAYACWPPLATRADYDAITREDRDFTPPVCLVHNLSGWGYGDFAEPLRAGIGLRCHGGYGSPDGVLPHSHVPGVLARALCMVHLKSVDAPGYSLYEALASACPVVIPERFVHRCRAYDLLEPGVTCLTFDRRDEPSAIDVPESVAQIREAVEYLKDCGNNRRIGGAGRERLDKLMWSAANPKDVGTLRAFVERHFP